MRGAAQEGVVAGDLQFGVGGHAGSLARGGVRPPGGTPRFRSGAAPGLRCERGCSDSHVGRAVCLPSTPVGGARFGDSRVTDAGRMAGSGPAMTAARVVAPEYGVPRGEASFEFVSARRLRARSIKKIDKCVAVDRNLCAWLACAFLRLV